MPTKSKLEADIDELIRYLDEYDYAKTGERSLVLSEDQNELIIDALVFYKEMNTY